MKEIKLLSLELVNFKGISSLHLDFTDNTCVCGANGTGKAAASYIPNMKIYAKTGTSNDQNDLWFVGGTPYYVASCWCGYDKQQSIPSSNSAIALKMWGNVMSKVHSGLPATEFTNSEYAVEKYYCTETGMLATSSCPSKSVGWYKKSNIPGYCVECVGGGSIYSGDVSGDAGADGHIPSPFSADIGIDEQD